LTAKIDPSAVVDTNVELADGVRIGPLCYVGAGVRIGEDTELVAQATVLGPARIGRGNRIFPYATLGAPPQDKSYRDEATELVIGDDNVFREQTTVHRGTKKGTGVTRIGSRCLFMVGAHVAHDCAVGDEVVLTNQATLGGHVQVSSNVVIGGFAAVAQYVRLGRGCFLAGGAMVERDVPPFVIAAGDRARVRALNLVGLRRMAVPDPSLRLLERAFRALYRSGEPLLLAMVAVRAELGGDPYVAELVDFLERKR